MKPSLSSWILLLMFIQAAVLISLGTAFASVLSVVERQPAVLAFRLSADLQRTTFEASPGAAFLT